MSDQPDQPTRRQSAQSDNQESNEALIFTPISIARARHASSHGHSVLGATRQTSAEPQSKASSDSKESSPETGSSSPISFLAKSNTCFVISLLGVAFVLGGILGGVVGGGLLLWANGDGRTVAAADETTTPTPLPSPTPQPAETATSTPTLEPPSNTPSPSDVIEKVIPSVVTVVNQQHNSFTNQLDEGRVVGSGVIIDSRGYIATNNHVVDHPGELRVLLADGRETNAQLVAANPAEDLAILKIGIADLPSIEWGNSHHIRLGQVVYAIGSPLGDFPNSVSFGIVSGLNRALEIDKFVIDGLIQTDAAINRGSSGGPLITPDGRVVGINTFIIRESEERGIAEGIAFSIPAETAKNLLYPWIAAHTGESIPIPASEESQ